MTFRPVQTYRRGGGCHRFVDGNSPMTRSLSTSIQVGRFAGLSGPGRATRVFLKRPLWAWPLLAGLTPGKHSILLRIHDKLGRFADATIEFELAGEPAVQLTCDQLKAPVVKEESTNFYKE